MLLTWEPRSLKTYLIFEHDKLSLKPHRKQKKAICLVKSKKVNSNF